MTDSVVPSFEAILSVSVRKSSPVPVYVQISEAIRAAIRNIPIPPGTPFPPERLLAESVGVSKMTLRQAYDLLQRDGLIECRRGVGTFVAHPRVDKSLPEMRSFTEEMTARGKVPSTRLLSFTVTRPSRAAAEFLHLAGSDLVYEIQRLRLGDGVPIAIERVQLPARLFPGLERFDLAAKSLYRVLEDHYGIQLERCAEDISASRPDKVQRHLLGIGPSVALLVITRKSYASNDAPVELTVTAYRGDIYTASLHAMRVRRRPEEPGLEQLERGREPVPAGS